MHLNVISFCKHYSGNRAHWEWGLKQLFGLPSLFLKCSPDLNFPLTRTYSTHHSPIIPEHLHIQTEFMTTFAFSADRVTCYNFAVLIPLEVLADPYRT
jgi:hypothetical protein